MALSNAKNRTSLHCERHRHPLMILGTFEPPRGRRPFSAPTKRGITRRSRDAERRSLLRLHARVQQDISQTAGVLLNEVGESTSASPDTADLARELSEQDVAVSLLDTATGTVEQIQAALDRIDDRELRLLRGLRREDSRGASRSPPLCRPLRSMRRSPRG